MTDKFVFIVSSAGAVADSGFHKFHNALFLVQHEDSSVEVWERTSFFHNGTRILRRIRSGVPLAKYHLEALFREEKMHFQGETVRAAAFPFAPYSLPDFETGEVQNCLMKLWHYITPWCQFRRH